MINSKEVIEISKFFKFIINFKNRKYDNSGVMPEAVYSGIDFYEYREYTEGDDIRFIDWNLLARLDKYIVRTFCNDYKSNVDIVIDTSTSMTLGEPPKKQLSENIFFFLANISKNNNSNYALYTFSDSTINKFKDYNALHNSYIKGEISYGGVTYLNRFINSYINLKKNSRADLLFFISDLHSHDNLEVFFNTICKAARRVIIFNVYSYKEIENIRMGRVLIQDPETGASREVLVNKLIKKAFLGNYDKFLNLIKKYAQLNGITLIQVDSASSMNNIIQLLLKFKVIKKER